MRKTLFLYIGHFRTGTTAVQEFLHLNPKLLRWHDLVFEGWRFAGMRMAEVDVLRDTMKKQSVALIEWREALVARLPARGPKLS